MKQNIEKYVSEYMANHGRQALSDDAAEQVVGGAFRKIDSQHAEWDGDIITREDFDAIIVSVSEQCNVLTAVRMLKDITGFDATRMGDNIHVILNRFWR